MIWQIPLIEQYTIKLNTHPRGQPRKSAALFYAYEQKGATNHDKTKRENPRGIASGN